MWNCDITYITKLVDNLTVIIWIFKVKMFTIMLIQHITIPHTSLECWRPQLSNDVLHNGVHPVLVFW